MIFMVILTIVFGALAALSIHGRDEDTADFLVMLTLIIMGVTIIMKVSANKEIALMRSHIENPTAYTYSQLAEHNERVTEIKFLQGTPFSFYNGVDLQLIDIDSVSQKVIIK